MQDIGTPFEEEEKTFPVIEFEECRTLVYIFLRDTLKQQLYIRTALIALTFAFFAGNGQVKTDLSHNNSSNIDGQAKIRKNHFISQPDEFFFVQCGLQDRSGNMWFGTAGDGIFYFDGTSFYNFTRQDDLNLNDILCCMEDKSGTIWFGTRRGLIVYKPSGKRPESKDFTTLLISANMVSHTTHQKIPDSYETNNNFVWSMLQDKTGKIWFGTNKGVCLYNSLTAPVNGSSTFTYFLDNDRLINHNHLRLEQVTSMLEDRNGHIWFVSNWKEAEGICRYDGKSLTNFSPGHIKSFRLAIERKNGNLLFLSSFQGVYSYNGKTFSKLPKEIGIKEGALITMMEDKRGTLWFGANSDQIMNGGDGGVLCYDGKKVKRLTTKDGLSHNCVFCIVGDKDGHIWFGTRNMGLCRYDRKSFTRFSE